MPLRTLSRRYVDVYRRAAAAVLAFLFGGELNGFDGSVAEILRCE